ncbi:MAG TPA: UDP-N-acetylmuramoyl-tripeptide--D-alanyl-D-alanine ligase [Rectinemataceae bacterium]|nr:UDP-N-acetylmuramoyl-tripeptide--D-alanyl-D-alanine ligase [Rectinemataceae bacterium]
MTEARVLFSAGEAAGMIGGACRGNLDALILDVVADSRKVGKGSLFVALPGDNVDGHGFIGAALRQGASCVMAALDKKEMALAAASATGLGDVGLGDSCFIFVESPLAGLQGLAREHRRRMKGLLRIGVTGSSGKTTTKECIGAALAPAYPAGTLAMSEGNLNSDIGLALSMFSLATSHKVGIFEMGMNRRGEMDELASIYEPDIAVITNIGTAHIGMIGSRRGIAEEKKRIFSRFSGSQRGFVWEDDPYKDFLKADVLGKISEFGPRSTVGLEKVENLGLGGWRLGWAGRRFTFALPGRHNLLNALAALSVAADLERDPALVATGLSSVKPLFGRSEIFEGRISLVRDCYNANPDSVAAAMDLCDSVECAGRKAYVLGSMRELGDTSIDEHAAMGRRAESSTADGLFFFGDEAEDSYHAAIAAANARSAGGRPGRVIFHTSDIESLKSAVLGYLKDGDLVLAKASRGLALERFTAALFDAGLVNDVGSADPTGTKGDVHAS